MPTGMNNGHSRQLALRLPHDLAERAETIASNKGGSVTQAVIAGLRRAWDMPDPSQPTKEVKTLFKRAHKVAAAKLSVHDGSDATTD